MPPLSARTEHRIPKPLRQHRRAFLNPEILDVPRGPSGVWAVDTSEDGANLGELQQIQLRESDIVTFHNYSWPEYFSREVAWLKRYNRPVICTNLLARSVGSTFDTILPIAKEERVGAINWGLVAGKTQTCLPW